MNLLNRTIEEVVQINVPNGQANASVRFTPPTGMVARVVAHYGTTIPNPGFVQIGLFGSDGVEIVKPQSIRSLRSRDVSFEHDGKLINLDTKGRTFVVKINSTANMTAEFNVELVLIYQTPEDDSCSVQN